MANRRRFRIQRQQKPEQSDICPHCGHQNRHLRAVCSMCGQHMPAAHPDHGITTKRLRRPRLVIPTRRRHRNPAAKDHLQQGVIYLKHVASRQFVEYPLRNGLITIGRSDDTQGIQPDIDLTPLKAQIHGVSRLHAGLRYERNQLYLKDMGSVNGTFYNGRKLIPESYRLVASGSHLQFGSLGLRIGFNSTTQ